MTTPTAPTSTPAPPAAGSTNTWANRAYDNTMHYLSYTREAGVKLYTSVDGAVTWAVENRKELIETAAKSMPAAGLLLQAVGTARADAANGASSAYNWGVALSGADGAYTAIAELKNAFSPSSTTPGNVPRIALGAIQVVGAGIYSGLTGADPNTQAAGAGVQAAATFGQALYTNYQNAYRSSATNPAISVPATAPQIPPLSFQYGSHSSAPTGYTPAAYTYPQQPAPSAQPGSSYPYGPPQTSQPQQGSSGYQNPGYQSGQQSQPSQRGGRRGPSH